MDLDRPATAERPGVLAPSSGSIRLGSLDAMRGFVIASMLLVNMTWDRESLPAQLFHVPWNDPVQGATFADLVFPWFVFMAGAAAPLSMRSGRGRGKSSGQMLAAAAVRGAKLYLIGVVLTVASWAHERPLAWDCLLSWNILQLLGVAYAAVVAAQLASPRVRVALVVAVLALKAGTLLLPYDWVTSMATPRPAEGAPVGPGTWAHHDAVKQLLHMEHVPVPSVASLLVGWVGMAQQWLPLAAIGVIGALATESLLTDRSWRGVGRLAAVGAGLVAIGWLLQAGYRAEGGGGLGLLTMPYSKWLFTPSYCLLAAGTGVVLLAAFAARIDTGRVGNATALKALGKNALAVYVGAELSFKLVFARWLLPLPDSPGADSIAGATQAWLAHLTGSAALASLGWAAIWLAGWWWIAWRMDRRGVYVRV